MGVVGALAKGLQMFTGLCVELIDLKGILDIQKEGG